MVDGPTPRSQAGPDPLRRLNASDSPPEIRRIAIELLPVFYDQLRRIARKARSKVGAGHTLQTTALVHEAYLRLGQAKSFADDKHFLRAAALAMRHALINHAEACQAAKRGGGERPLTLSHADDLRIATDEGLLQLNEALERLTVNEPRLASIVECRFFAGFSDEETAGLLGLSRRTVQRDWFKARAWLYRELTGHG
jgi:RNA polymerase sigma factor (TIGR02999 family)